MEEQNLPAYKDYTVLEAKVQNERGLHARPCTLIAKECFKYDDSRDITVKRVDNTQPTCSCRSVMGMISLEASKGTELEIRVSGIDDQAQKIAKKMQTLFSNIYEYSKEDI